MVAWRLWLRIPIPFPHMRTAIYPGSFDPIHNGHLDVIARAARLCDRVVVAVAVNHAKSGLFPMDERVALIRKASAHIPGVEVRAFEGLLVDFVREQGGDAVIRGLRAVSDFEYEFQMALMNRRLDENFETLFLMPSQEHIYLSSRIVKEVAALGGEIGGFVPAVVREALEARLAG
jgi:pantetheine-phosphate adenylyltransferase